MCLENNTLKLPDFNFWYALFFWENIKNPDGFSINSQHWDDTNIWNSSSWNPGIYLSYTINSVAADAPVE